MLKKRSNKDMHFPAKRRILDDIKLLFSDLEFQSRIKKIREYLKLPLGGFDKETPDRDDKCAKWYREMCSRSESMADNDFWKKLKNLRQQLNAGEINQKQHDEMTYKLHDPLPVNYFTRQIDFIIKDFNVPSSYHNPIYHYILYNEISNTPIIPFVEIRDENRRKGEKSVTIKFYMKLTDADLKHLKYYINDLVGKDLPSFSPLKDIDTKIVIDRYHQNREVFNEGDQEYYKLSAKEIAENVKCDTGKRIRSDQVYEVPRELRELRQKRYKKDLGKSTE
ncbi:MAG: hypothetical protein WC657_03355 [Candidatus Paceibacterota bacterium]